MHKPYGILSMCQSESLAISGVERIHDDLKDNWDATASYDFNDDDLDPSPRMTEDSENM